MSERTRERAAARPRPDAVRAGLGARLVRPYGISLDADRALQLDVVESGAKAVLALLFYYDPTTGSFFPAQSPRGIPESIIRAFKPDTNTYEYPRLDDSLYLLVRPRQPRSVTCYSLSVGTTPTPLSTSPTSFHQALVQASAANTAAVLLGSASAQLLELQPGSYVVLDVPDVSVVYARSASGTQTLVVFAQAW